jgi:integrase
VTWHQFRHVHSSLLHDLGAPAKVAQQQLGHASVDTILRVYTRDDAPEGDRGSREGFVPECSQISACGRKR